MDKMISVALLVLVFFASLTLMFGCVQGGTQEGAAQGSTQAAPSAGGTAEGGAGVPSGTAGAQIASPGATGQDGNPSQGMGRNATGSNSTSIRGRGGAPPEGQGQPGSAQRGNITDAERKGMDSAMVSACSGKSEGDACEMATPMGTVNGACNARNSTNGTQIACGFGNGFLQQGGPQAHPDGGQ